MRRFNRDTNYYDITISTTKTLVEMRKREKQKHKKNKKHKTKIQVNKDSELELHNIIKKSDEKAIKSSIMFDEEISDSTLEGTNEVK